MGVDPWVMGRWAQAEAPTWPSLGLCPAVVQAPGLLFLPLAGAEQWEETEALPASTLVSMAVGAAKTSRQEMPSPQFPGNGS